MLPAIIRIPFAGLGVGHEAARPCLYGCHNHDTYLVCYSSKLERSATYYYCCGCVLCATPYYTRNIIPLYLVSICIYMGYVTALLLLS